MRWKVEMMSYKSKFWVSMSSFQVCHTCNFLCHNYGFLCQNYGFTSITSKLLHRHHHHQSLVIHIITEELLHFFTRLSVYLIISAKLMMILIFLFYTHSSCFYCQTYITLHSDQTIVRVSKNRDNIVITISTIWDKSVLWHILSCWIWITI